jgi:FixJ family two-component response regulator
MGHQPLIAVVDGDASARAAARSLIGALGFRVATFESMEAFMASDSVGDAACLVVELRTAPVRGDALAARPDRAGRAIPTIATSAVPHATTRLWTEQAGILACLEKPLEPESLMQALRAALAQDGPLPGRTASKPDSAGPAGG